MRAVRVAIGVWACLALGCASPRTAAPLTSGQAAEISIGIRAFMSSVAAGVSTQGPAAWRDYFANTPQFFMASDGRLAFASGEGAAEGIVAVTKLISRIELRWGNEIRVDPLTPTLVMVAAPYHESLAFAAGGKAEEDGYFTGLAELGSTGWRFRNAHWSVVRAPVASP